MNIVKLLVTEIDMEMVVVTIINDCDLLDRQYVMKIFQGDCEILTKDIFNKKIFELIKTHRVEIVTPEVSLAELEEELHDLR